LRRLLEPPRTKHLTQGTIFNGALAEDYKGCRVNGIIITARCDLSHDKVSRYTHLPVVRLDDWLARDGAEIAYIRIHRDLRNSFGNQLRQCGYATELLATESPRRITEALIAVESPDAKIKRAKEKLVDLAHRLDQCDSCMAPADPSSRIQRLVELNVRIVESVARELMGSRLAGFYFIEGPLDDDDGGHVALLREARHISRVIAEAMPAGLDMRALRADASLAQAAQNVIHLDGREMILPIAQMRSPYLEQMMQHFALLFSRIGVPDLPEQSMNQLMRRHALCGDLA
jgi:hypothetical protein